MILTLKGIEIDVPEGASVEISEDGTKLKIGAPGQEVIEVIRVVEVEGPVRETIRLVPQPTPTIINPFVPYISPNTTPPTYPYPGPCDRPYGPFWVATGTTTGSPLPVITTTGTHTISGGLVGGDLSTTIPNGSYTIGGFSTGNQNSSLNQEKTHDELCR